MRPTLTATARRFGVVAALCIGIALGGCRGGDDHDCRAVAKHYAEMVSREVGASPDKELSEALQANLPSLRDTMAETCREREWSGAVRRCIVAAESIADLEECDPTATPPAAESGADGDAGPG